ncbi:MAG: methylmalonyl Co-A mutase-associated GTPase MeaB [Deltaproteobacteria bacterium]|nr:methylmalonyl Co-A mutase-associated GTPase MeaB [Deltaproteobacteria bacterium]
MVDDRRSGVVGLLAELYRRGSQTWILGITGTPGAGKSTLTNQMIRQFRSESLRVGVVAVDPSSPFSGGAILGDRIRMQDHFEDAGVFIRSVATRGAQGGLSRTARDIALVLGVWGADIVVLETVGVGQDELDVTRAADTTVVVVPPGMGDEIQATKAGLLECADVFALNKSDLPGAAQTRSQIEMMMSLGAALSPTSGSASASGSGPKGSDEPWQVPICSCVGTTGEGVGDLINELRRHRRWTEDSSLGIAAARARQYAGWRTRLRQELVHEFEAEHSELAKQVARQITDGDLDPEEGFEQIRELLRPRAR